MPKRSKDEAELRMSMRVARLAKLQGKDTRDAINAVYDHLANVRHLENGALPDKSDGGPATDAPEP